jgi:hypothetical protein
MAKKIKRRVLGDGFLVVVPGGGFTTWSWPPSESDRERELKLGSKKLGRLVWEEFR